MFGFIRKWREKRARDKARRKGLGSMNSPVSVSWGKPPRHGVPTTHGTSSAATVYTAPMYYPEAITGTSSYGGCSDGGSGSSSSDSGCSGSSGGGSD